MTHETARKQGLEPVYPELHHLGQRIFWDAREGKYYDAGQDIYLENFDPYLQMEC